MKVLTTMMIAGAATAFAATASTGALAQATATQPPGKTQQAAALLTDAEFAQKATMGNRYEIEAGKLALSKSTNPKIKNFADMMVTDHTAALKKLDQAAEAAGTPVAQPGLDAAHQGKIDVLIDKTGADFESQYKADQKKAHEEAVALLTAYKQSGKNEKLRAWADEALPTVLKHRDAIDAL